MAERKKFSSVAIKRIFEKKIVNAGECWLWMGDQSKDGHPVFCWKGRWFSARRFVFESRLKRLEPADKLDVGCGNPRCVRPKHMILRPPAGPNNENE